MAEKDDFTPIEDDDFTPVDDAPPVAMGSVTPASVAAGRAMQGARRFAPDILAAPGGFIPGPLGWITSALGGMLGRPLTGEPMSPPVPAVPGYPYSPMLPPEVMLEGGKQEALSAAGAVPGAMLRGVGTAAYRGALRPTAALLKKFPRVVQQMVDLRIPLGGETAEELAAKAAKAGVAPKASKSGEAMAEKALSKATAEQGVVLDAAEQAGVQVPTSGALRAGQQMIQRAMRSQHKTVEKVAALQKEIDAFVRDNAPNLTPNQANELVKSLQEELDAAFQAKKAGTYLKGGQRIVKKLQQQLEAEMRKALRKAVPGIQKAKQATQAAMAAKAGAAHARVNIDKGVPARVPIIPTLVRSTIPDELRSIEAMARLGLGLTHPASVGAARQLPRAASAAFTAMQPSPEDRMAEAYRGRERELQALQQSYIQRGDRQNADLIQRVLDRLGRP